MQRPTAFAESLTCLSMPSASRINAWTAKAVEDHLDALVVANPDFVQRRDVVVSVLTAWRRLGCFRRPTKNLYDIQGLRAALAFAMMACNRSGLPLLPAEIWMIVLDIMACNHRGR